MQHGSPGLDRQYRGAPLPHFGHIPFVVTAVPVGAMVWSGEVMMAIGSRVFRAMFLPLSGLMMLLSQPQASGQTVVNPPGYVGLPPRPVSAFHGGVGTIRPVGPPPAPIRPMMLGAPYRPPVIFYRSPQMFSRQFREPSRVVRPAFRPAPGYHAVSPGSQGQRPMGVRRRKYPY